MWGMRNRIPHTYSRVEETVVIATVRDDLPEIRTRIRAYLDTSEERVASVGSTCLACSAPRRPWDCCLPASVTPFRSWGGP